MSIQTLAPGLVELSERDATDTEGGLVIAAAVLLVWMGKAFIAGATIGVAAATVYYANQD